MAKRSLEVSLPMEMVLRLKMRAAVLGVPVSKIVEIALREFAAKYKWHLEPEKREVPQ